jgi:dephospho-CoA kinase
VEYLASKGFEKISLSDLIREEAVKRGMELTRRNLQDLGSEMRGVRGLGVWATKALELMAADKDYVIDSIRNPGEIKTLAGAGNFILLAVDAPIKIRFARLAQRNLRNEKEPQALEDFIRSEARELGSKGLASQQLRECTEMADFTITNDSDKESFFRKIDAALVKIGREIDLN